MKLEYEGFHTGIPQMVGLFYGKTIHKWMRTGGGHILETPMQRTCELDLTSKDWCIYTYIYIYICILYV